jgi:hypothetical protein
MSAQNELSVVTNNTPAFIQDATNSLEKMEAYASMLIKSGLVPKHFYELDTYRNPVKDANGVLKGNTSAVIMTIQHGLELGMSITQSLQQIVPVNGLMSVKGDAAKALIMKSGLCKEWIEEEIQAGDDSGTKITSTRKDGQKMSRTFTIKDAKRAGLWIDDAMVAKNEKLRHSPWYKYQSRMLRYRALGFIARDLYGDVLQNMYTEDEARDLNEDNTVVLTADGITGKVMGSANGNNMLAAAEQQLTETKTAEPAKRVTKPTAGKKAEAQPQPKEEKQDQVIHGVEFEEVKPKPLEEVRAMEPKQAFDYINSVIGFDMQTRLFDQYKDKKTKRILIEIYTAFLAGQVETYIKANFELETSEEKQLPLIEAGNEWPKLPESGRRDFGDAMTIADAFIEKGIQEGDILDALQSNGLEFESVEDFYKRATVEVLNMIYNA